MDARITSRIPADAAIDKFPVNSYEAESRRLARFFRHGHQRGKFTPPPEDSLIPTFPSRSICACSDADIPNNNRNQRKCFNLNQRRAGSSAADKAAPPNLLSSYKTSGSGFDELVGDDGALRSHYSKLTGALEKLGFNELTARRETASRILREHGVTYNIYGDTQGQGRPWALDLVPLIIPPEEWREVEAGLTQRARLLNLLLADFYGPQQLLREGVLPPALLQANPAFLRPCHGIVPPKNIFCFCRPWISRALPMGNGGYYPIARKRRQARATPWKIASCLSRELPEEFASAMRAVGRASFVLRDTLRSLATRDRPASHTWCC